MFTGNRSRLILILVLMGLSIVFSSCREVVPPPGSAIYCPQCDRDIFYRAYGTTKTSFRPREWVAMTDARVPIYLNDKFNCPFCGGGLVKEYNADMETVSFHTRPLAWN